MKKRKEINELCKKCIGSCKQSKDVELLGCPHFEKKPEQIQFGFFKNKKKDYR